MPMDETARLRECAYRLESAARMLRARADQPKSHSPIWVSGARRLVLAGLRYIDNEDGVDVEGEAVDGPPDAA